MKLPRDSLKDLPGRGFNNGLPKGLKEAHKGLSRLVVLCSDCSKGCNVVGG